MKISVARELIIVIDSNQIPDAFVDSKNVTTSEDVANMVTNWNDLKKAAAEQDGQQAEADITAWSAKK